MTAADVGLIEALEAVERYDDRLDSRVGLTIYRNNETAAKTTITKIYDF